ncbi:DUF2523 family protein [Providencia stuartii]|uniref:Phage-related membrane protein n=1 Tax=Providencia stuartii (strain MRSN 2154) TaxID=1157951 RepID=A0A140SSF9_PROSM|nr:MULTISPECIES: DUF2523 family protein [Providencia]AFH91928.1 phage-related membrane protein [Providencia stuartii MRSN 2154]MDE8744685.1 DUF2523 family protein [Providencia thailandensis]MDE8765905.1 DUF2523 family protein [Providencia thailandensis]MDE8778361.1 DUF2523 family protein [Providencia thailandensis]MDE8782617.1 DUF2523 family protein [Providencia thailandensis]
MNKKQPFPELSAEADERAVFIDWFLPKSTNLAELFGSLPDAIWYFLNLLQFPLGVPLVISAMLTRFIIRRLPIIG